MADNRKIVAARIIPPQRFGDTAMVHVTIGSEAEVPLFSYFNDEISFTAAELIGLTADQAHDLRHAKDVAYLTRPDRMRYT